MTIVKTGPNENLYLAAGPNEKIYPVVKLAAIVNLLALEGVSAADALRGVDLSKSAISLPTTRISINQLIQCFRNASRLSRDPRFAYHAGLRFHVSTYGMYGFAILCSTDFRRTMRFASEYLQLATPHADASFREDGDLAVWSVVPIPHPGVDATLYRFLVELTFGTMQSLHRDVMGPSFAARELHVTYRPPDNAAAYTEAFGCPVLFAQSENAFVFDAAWLNQTPALGNELTYKETVELCNRLLEDMRLHIGLAGRVREILLANLMHPTRIEAVAKDLHMTSRTLKRKLSEENTSFRKLADELRTQVAIKFLRDTELTVEDIAYSLGFDEAANFRRAFRRWTKATPLEFRPTAQSRVRRTS